LVKYNFQPEQINLKLRNYETLRLENRSFSNLFSIQEFFKQYAELSNTEDCEFGNDVYLDSVRFDSLLYNTDIDFQTYNVSNTAVIRKRSLERLNFYNERFTSNQKQH
jgi:hypothetical protein